LVLQRERVSATLLATYVALVIAQTWAKPIYEFLNGNRAIFKIYIAGRVSPFSITAALFVIFVILIAQKSGLKSARSESLSNLEVLVFSLCSTALIIATILSFMPQEDLGRILEASKIARLLLRYHNLLIVLPPLLIILFGIRRGD